MKFNLLDLIYVTTAIATTVGMCLAGARNGVSLEDVIVVGSFLPLIYVFILGAVFLWAGVFVASVVFASQLVLEMKLVVYSVCLLCMALDSYALFGFLDAVIHAGYA